MSALICCIGNLRQIEKAVIEKFGGVVSDESRQATRLLQQAYAGTISEREANERGAALLAAWRKRKGMN